MQDEYEWFPLDGFPDYMINQRGDVQSKLTQKIMRQSSTQFGDPKISLFDANKARRTMSVRLLVAKTFLEPHENPLFDYVISKDMNAKNVHVSNLAWRPWWFVQAYAQQFRCVEHLDRHRLIPVAEYAPDLTLVANHPNIITAAMAGGVLMTAVWESTISGSAVFPDGHNYTVI